MLPALQPGRLVIGVSFLAPKAGDVVVVAHNNKEKIKRIKTIDEHEVFVVGDAQDASTDSRHFGALTRHAVLAKIIWPRV